MGVGHPALDQHLLPMLLYPAPVKPIAAVLQGIILSIPLIFCKIINGYVPQTPAQITNMPNKEIINFILLIFWFFLHSVPPADGSGDASTTQTGNIIPPNISITNLQGNVNITNIQGIIPGLPNVQVILA